MPKDLHESPEERLQRRRVRRWKRRGRIVAPFLGIPLLMGTLALSVDLIEYTPQNSRERLSDRPLPSSQAIERRQNAQAAVRQGAMRLSPSAALATTPSVATAEPDLANGTIDLDLPADAQGQMPLLPPTQPHPSRSTRAR